MEGFVWSQDDDFMQLLLMLSATLSWSHLGIVCEVRMATSCTTEQQIKARFLVGLAVMVAAKCCLIAYLGFCVESWRRIHAILKQQIKARFLVGLAALLLLSVAPNQISKWSFVWKSGRQLHTSLSSKSRLVSLLAYQLLLLISAVWSYTGSKAHAQQNNRTTNQGSFPCCSYCWC